MYFNYIDFSGKLKKLVINGLFFKFFFNINIIYQFFIYYNSYYRSPISSQKSRSFVNFSTKKLYKQKGTGRARAGSFSSHLRVSGSKSFPNSFYSNFKVNFNNFFYKYSYFIFYSNLFFNNYFIFFEDLFFLEFKVKLFFYFIKNLFFNFNMLLLTIKIEKNFFLSINNLKNFSIFYFFNFNPIFLLKFKKIFITRSCLNYFNDKFL